MLDIEHIIQYGVCRDIPNGLQRCGRGGRAASTSALFLVLYEPWVKTADLSSLAQDLSDPDQPLQALTKTSKKPERTGVAMYRLIQSSDCIRRFFANYLCDDTPTALDFTNRFCCDRHDDGFNIADFFPGNSDAGETFIFIDQATNVATSRAKHRPVKEREPLKVNLYAWRSRIHQADPLRGVRQISWILTDAEIDLISKTARTSLTNVDQLKILLGANSDWVREWGQGIIDEVSRFNDIKL